MSEIRIIGVNNKAFPLEANFIQTVNYSIDRAWTRILMNNGREYYTAEKPEDLQKRVDVARDKEKQKDKAKVPKPAKEPK